MNELKIAAYQFKVTNDIDKNYGIIENAVRRAKEQNADLIAFPECSLTGYPPRDMDNSKCIDFKKVEASCGKLQNLSDEINISIIVGTIFKKQDIIFNRAVCFRPNQPEIDYDKRALYGWDSENFDIGSESGIFELRGIKIGIRICFEIRFPEYFRELYREKTDINIVLFYDVADEGDFQRYDMIKGHIQTRAVENVTTTMSVNTIWPYQMAPTAVFDKSGLVCQECNRGNEEMLIYNFIKKEDDFGERGRRLISNQFLKGAAD